MVHTTWLPLWGLQGSAASGGKSDRSSWAAACLGASEAKREGLAATRTAGERSETDGGCGAELHLLLLTPVSLRALSQRQHLVVRPVSFWVKCLFFLNGN